MILTMDSEPKQKYMELKKRLRQLLAENESYKQELGKTNERLLKVSKDKSFLLDQLLQFEGVDSSSTESDLSSSDVERDLPQPPPKKTKKQTTPRSQNPSTATRRKANPKTTVAKARAPAGGVPPARPQFSGVRHVPQNVSHPLVKAEAPTLTPEQVELHLQQASKRVPLPPTPASLTLPAELFNEDAFLTDFAAEQII